MGSHRVARCWARALCVALIGVTPLLAKAAARDTFSDTWVATDGLGRTLPLNDTTGDPRPNMLVGVFYYIWHQRSADPQVYDISQITSGLTQPWSGAPWGPSPAFHWWSQPYLGYYDINDDFVQRKHAQMLADAGVDVLFFDVTNALTYDSTYQAICSVYESMRANGARTPQFAFLTHTSADTVMQHLYDDFYSKGSCQDLWFMWNGKPIILGPMTNPSQQVLDFFTHRDSWAWQPGEDQWPWLDDYPQRFGWDVNAQTPEEIPVGVAQHPLSDYGRSYHAGAEPPLIANYVTADTALGLGFQEQWGQALKVAPPFVFVTQWNEWMAQRFLASCPPSSPSSFLGVPLNCGNTYFVDEFNEEFSRDVEPMTGGFEDAYYYQLVSYIRQLKGTRAAPQSSPGVVIDINGDFSTWDDVGPDYIDDIGDTTARDHLGFAGPTTYTNDTGRNDIAVARVARDGVRVYFYVRTAGPLSPSTDPDWMQLLVDSDHDPTTGWNGFDFLINRSRGTGTCSVEANVGGAWSWQKVADAPMQFANNELELSVDRSTLGVPSVPGQLVIDFKWVDNLPDSPSPMDFIDKGDSAPNGRFKYRFVENPATAPSPSLGTDAASDAGLGGGEEADGDADAMDATADDGAVGDVSPAAAASDAGDAAALGASTNKRGGCACGVSRDSDDSGLGTAALLLAVLTGLRHARTRERGRHAGKIRMQRTTSRLAGRTALSYPCVASLPSGSLSYRSSPSLAAPDPRRNASGRPPRPSPTALSSPPRAWRVASTTFRRTNGTARRRSA